jgi:hypothetical protein
MEALLKAAQEIDNMNRKPKKKRGKPEKACPECNHINHARSSNCKSCDHMFYVRKNVREVELAKNWHDLEPGDIIKVITGSGPYFLSKDKPGEKIMLGKKGKFEVVEIWDGGPRNCGIVGRQLYTRGRKANVREYIYMGEPFYNEELCNHNEPHRIKVIKKHENG